MNLNLSSEEYVGQLGMETPSPKEIEDRRSIAGRWSRSVLEGWGVPWPPPRGWRHRLIERYYEQQNAELDRECFARIEREP